MANFRPAMQPEPTFPVGSDRGVGATLHRAREERGVSVADVAQATRIRSRYLEALENDAPQDDFPGRVYARFFLREYARYLRLPDQPLVEALDARWTDGQPEEETLAPVLALARVREPRRWVGRLVTLAAAGVLIALVAISMLSGAKDRPGTTPIGSTPSGSAPGVGGVGTDGTGSSNGHTGVGQETPPQVSSITARLVVSDRCWVYATAADGRVLFSRTLEPGQRTTLRARRGLDLQLGNAAGVMLTLNGKHVPVGQGVVHLSFAVRNGKLVTS